MQFCDMTFVGQQRHEMVENLVADFDHVISGKGPRIVLLTSPPGWGKTRVVQEFYRRIAAKQSTPAYWPKELVDTHGLLGDSSSMNALLHARKLVYPRAVNVPKGSSMDWMWWGVLCQRRGNGELTEAMFDSVAQLNAHAGAIAAPSKGQALDITLSLVGVLGALGVVAVGGPVGAALAVTGVGTSTYNNREIITQLKTWWDRRKGNEINLEHGHSIDQIEELSRNLAQTTRSKPLVLVIDDAQYADDSLVKILDGLVTERANVLIILTTWPNVLTTDQYRPLSTWWSAISARVGHLVRHEDLQLLESNDLKLVAADDGLVIDADVSAIQGNVLALRGALRLPAVRREIERGHSPDLSRYTQGPDAVFHEYWDDLPDSIRHVLAIAAQTGTQYVPSLVTAAALNVGITNAQQHLLDGIDVYRLAREIDATLHAFTDPLLYAIAERRGKERELSDEDYLAIRSAISAAVLDVDLIDALSTEARLAVRRQHVSLVREGLLPSDQSAADSAMDVARAEDARYSYRNATEMSGLAIGWQTLPPDHVDMLPMRNDHAYWMGRSGKVNEAISLFREILVDRTRVLGADHVDSLESRYEIAHFLRDVGKTTDAIEMLEELLEDQLRVLGPDHHHTLGTAGDVANLLGNTGRVEESIKLLEQSLVDHERVLGHDHRDTLITRNNLATRLGQVGRLDEGVTLLSGLLNDCLRNLGPDHPETLRVRGNLAYWLGESGRADEALQQTSALLEQRIRVLGRDHRDTFSSRLNLAGLLSDVGKVPEALREYNALIEDSIRLFGPDYPFTIQVRHNVAFLLGETGQFDLAVEQLSVVLKDRLRVLGADDPYTLSTRHNLATFIADMGEIDEAISQLQQVQADRTRVLGPRHLDTYSTRLYIVLLLARNNQREIARGQLHVLVDEMTINLGPNHKDTLLASEILEDFKRDEF